MLSNNTRSHPESFSASTSDQWAAITRYDASRKVTLNSTSNPHNKIRRTSDQAPNSGPLKQSRRLSLGDDLPHMPVDLLTPPTYTPLFQSRSSLGSTTLRPSSDCDKDYPSSDVLTRPQTPPALKGDNAILIDREVNRLRDRHSKAIQRHWRIYTGTAMLVVTGLCAFVLGKYILAYLSLSPAGWVLSDAANGTHSTPDPLLRKLALICVCASGIALLGALSSGFYLRFSRRKSCGTYFVWIAAITSTTVNILLCVINLALIAIWHRKYSSSADGFATTRDVSQRCSGSWALDVLWQAAKSSSQAKVDKDSLPTCPHDAKGTLQNYLMAGGIRLAVFVAFSTLWLICLARYNCTLQHAGNSLEKVEESAEMHRLLMEVDEGKLSNKMKMDDTTTVPGSYREDDLYRGGLSEDYSIPTTLAPPPRLDGFRWYKESSTVEEAQAQACDQVQKQHEKEASARAWSVGVVGQVWGALLGTNETVDRHQVAQDDLEDDDIEPLHDRQASRLGVRGWFRRDTSEQASEDYGMVITHNSDNERASNHLRTPSQEKRAREGRHAAARLAKIQEEESIIEAKSREENNRLEQQQRLEFLAYLAGDGGKRCESKEVDKDNSSRRSSQSAGDDLPHMPELTRHTRIDDLEEDDIYWQSLQETKLSKDQPATNLYVRTMGKLIRKLSAIESEGSQERTERAGRSVPSGSEYDLY